MVDTSLPHGALVLVTGGAGFIGAHCVRQLLAKGCSVRVLDNLSAGRREALSLDDPLLDFRPGDIREPGAVAAAMAGVTHVLHLAAQVSVAASLEAPLDSAATNISGFLNVLEAARRTGVQRLVYASSAAVYGNAPAPQHEEMVPAPRSPYALEKLVNEQYAALYQHLHALPTLGLRYFNVYGPGQRDDSIYSGVINCFSGRLRAGSAVTLHGDGQQSRDFIHVHDVARLSCLALHAAVVGVVNVGTGQRCSIAGLLEQLMALHGPGTVLQAPRRPADVDASCAGLERLRAWLGHTALIPLEVGLASAAGAPA